MLKDFNFSFKCACSHASHPWLMFIQCSTRKITQFVRNFSSRSRSTAKVLTKTFNSFWSSYLDYFQSLIFSWHLVKLSFFFPTKMIRYKSVVTCLVWIKKEKKHWRFFASCFLLPPMLEWVKLTLTRFITDQGGRFKIIKMNLCIFE